MLGTWNVVKVNSLPYEHFPHFLRGSSAASFGYNSCFLGKGSLSGPAGLPQPHLMAMLWLSRCSHLCFSGVGQTSVLCVPNCREPTNSSLTHPPAQAQEIALSMPPLGMGSDLKYSSLQINALPKWAPKLVTQSYCTLVVVPHVTGSWQLCSNVLHHAASLISFLVYFGGISCLLSQTLQFRNMLHKEVLMN